MILMPNVIALRSTKWWAPTTRLFNSINGISLKPEIVGNNLSNEDLQKNKALLENFAKGNVDQQEAPPGQFSQSWNGKSSCAKKSSKAFKATVAMSEDFPLTVDMLLKSFLR
ncbi:hypothetical protein TCAL_14564 [Tigriopus californicus]|uniref:Ankyrin repeat domain-containing protein n=1 Tax=Tigriopus californicus TaxID=6832 RepID=A0A553PAX6_TIGCA|nr:hypothetical protein TCAL_14564 [Tigriopus californicus]